MMAASHHGFLYSGGGFTTIDVPGATSSQPGGSTTPARSSELH